VAAGLDSLVVGEPQILGQVKDAFQVAATRQCVGPVLTRLFTPRSASASACARKRRSAKAPSRWDMRRSRSPARSSAASTAAACSSSAPARSARSRRSTCGHKGVGEIVITSRTAAHATRSPPKSTGAPFPGATCASAGGRRHRHHGHRVAAADLARADIETVTGRRRGEPLFIIDIAVPRDVEASVGEIEQVFLYNVDDLQAVVQENLSRRSSEIGRAESIVSEEVERFAAWRRSRGAVPTVVALRQRFEQIRRAELQRLEHKLGGLSPEARASVDEVTRLIVEKLLLAPTSQLKALPTKTPRSPTPKPSTACSSCGTRRQPAAPSATRWTPDHRIGHALS
jgi:glutamyl-tRNA reductase